MLQMILQLQQLKAGLSRGNKMPFFKRLDDELLTAPNFVYGPGFELKAESKDEYIYPVDGWVWADSLDAAMNHPQLRQQVTSITIRQARLALLQAGLLGAVEAAIAALPEPMQSAARIEWEYANEVQRHNGFVANIAPLLGLDEPALDALFLSAAAL